MWKIALECAKKEEVSSFKIFSDPPAVEFYIKMGTEKIGEKPSRILNDPNFPVFDYKI